MSVGELLETVGALLGLRLAAGARGLDRGIGVARVQQPGLALAGFLPQLHPDRVQVLGNSEIAYLATLDPARAGEAVGRVAAAGVACFVVTNGQEPPGALVEAGERHATVVLASTLRTAEFIRKVTTWLEERLAPFETMHGDLVEVHGVGTLILGRSGVGKSEAALDLVSRGHRLVADDVVIVRRISPAELRGRAAPLLAHHMEIRGLGIIDVAALFGTLATVEERSVDFVVELVEWSPDADRLGIVAEHRELLEVVLPLVRLPVRPGRSIGMLIETAVRNQLLRHRGHASAERFAAQIDRAAAGGRDGP